MAGSTAADDDIFVTFDQPWFTGEVVVEEKLDGANVAVWYSDDGRLDVATRGGPGAMDRGGQLGRLRAWVAARHDALVSLLGGELRLYGEWMWRRHTIRYTRLPDWLLCIDLQRADGTRLSAAERARRCAPAGVHVAPVLFRGVLGDRRHLQALCGQSTFGDEPMEGMILRREAGGSVRDVAKWVRSAFVADLGAEHRPNTLASGELGMTNGIWR